jgi:hypothetical protein
LDEEEIVEGRWSTQVDKKRSMRLARKQERCGVKATLRISLSTKEEGTGPLARICESQQNKGLSWTERKRSMIITRRESKRVRYLELMEVAGMYVVACFFLGSALFNSIPQYHGSLSHLSQSVMSRSEPLTISSMAFMILD